MSMHEISVRNEGFNLVGCRFEWAIDLQFAAAGLRWRSVQMQDLWINRVQDMDVGSAVKHESQYLGTSRRDGRGRGRVTSTLSSKYCPLLPPPRSTIASAFSPDGKTLASTHGDHTVKIIDCETGRCLRVLRGHQRTPWVGRFHPLYPETYLQVEVWIVKCVYGMPKRLSQLDHTALLLLLPFMLRVKFLL